MRGGKDIHERGEQTFLIGRTEFLKGGGPTFIKEGGQKTLLKRIFQNLGQTDSQTAGQPASLTESSTEVSCLT